MVNSHYKTVQGIQLPARIYPPQVESRFSKTLVLCIHGGGWHAVDKNEDWDGGWMDYQARYFAQKGFTGAVISYRSISLSTETTVFDQLEDCRDGLAFLAKQTQYERLILIGDSAGGHLAAMLTLQTPELADIAVLCNPVTDCTAEKWAYAAKPDELEKASPLYSMRKTKTKYLMLHGDADKVVAWETTQEFYEGMKKQGNDCTFILLPGVGHAFILKGYLSADSQVAEYMDIIEKYIEQNF